MAPSLIELILAIEPPVEDADVVLTIYASLREVEGLVLLL